MPFIINFLLWAARGLEFLFGFFPWLFRFLKRFFAKRIDNGRFLNQFLDHPLYTVAMGFFLTSVVAVFLGLLKVLISIYLKLFESIKGFTSGSAISGSSSSAGGTDAVALFIDILNSLGFLEAIKDTFSIWGVGFLLPLLSLIGSIIYYKSVVKFISKISNEIRLKNSPF